MATLAQLAADTLRAREAESRRVRETRERAVRLSVEAIVRERVAAPARAWLIGSLAWGGFGTRSDVDLVLSGVSRAEASSLEQAVAAAAETSVEILVLEELPSAFRARVLAEGVRLA